MTHPADTVRWLRPWTIAAIVVLAIATVVTAFADDMPANHRLLVPIGVLVMLVAWGLELSGLPWPRLVLISAIFGVNVWLTLIGHVSVNYMFLFLVVAWVGVRGTRVEGLLALALSIATIGLTVVLDARDRQIAWSAPTTWVVGLLLVYVMALILRRQVRLVALLHVLRLQTEQRNRELDTLLTVSRSVASTLEMNPLLDAVLDALGSVVDYAGTAILTLDDQSQALTFARWRGPASFAPDAARQTSYRVEDFQSFWPQLAAEKPMVISDVRADTPEAQAVRQMLGEADVDTTYAFIHSLMWVPLVVRGRITGILSIASDSPNAFGERESTLALAIARQAAVAIENARLHVRSRQVAVLEERQRLVREPHDSVTQSLYGVSLYAEAATRALAEGGSEPAADNLRQIRETTQEALGEMRLLLYELRPPLLEEHGLAAAIQTRLHAVEARAGLEVEFTCHGDERLAADKEQELYRIAQEALNNVVRHAHARRVVVRLDVASDRAVLDIGDDGVGFEPDLRGGDGYGLPGMRERVSRLGGTLTIESTPQHGMCVQVEVPR